jgi:hypothetical protein
MLRRNSSVISQDTKTTPNYIIREGPKLKKMSKIKLEENNDFFNEPVHMLDVIPEERS